MFRLTQLRALNYYILCFSIYPYYGHIITCQFSMYSLNMTILYIYIFIDIVLFDFVNYYIICFFDIPLVWAYHHLSVYISWPSLNMTRSFLNLHIISYSRYSLVVLFSQTCTYILHNERYSIILYYSVCCINVQLNFFMVYSPLLLNLQNI